jgi:hypothetical protein
LEFLAVGAAEIQFIAGKANGHGIAWLPLPRGVTLGCCGIVFTGVDHSFYINHDGAANEVRSRLAEDFGFGLVPVFKVVTFDGAALLIELGGATTDGFSHFRRIVLGTPRHIRIASRMQS